MTDQLALVRCAVGYYRTSSSTNVDGDSLPRQTAAVAEYATRSGYEVRQGFYDAAVKGSDRIAARPGFQALLAWCEEQGCKTILVENASRFARDLIVSETGYTWLKSQGYTLIAVDDPDSFTADTPTARMVRQILGSVAEFEKANLVAKLKAARDRKSAAVGYRIDGRKLDQTQVVAVRKIGTDKSLRQIATMLAERGIVTVNGTALSAAHIARLKGAADKK